MVNLALVNKRKVIVSLSSLGILSIALVISVIAVRNSSNLLSQAAAQKLFYYGSVLPKVARKGNVQYYFLRNGQADLRLGLATAANVRSLEEFANRKVEVWGNILANGRLRIISIRLLSVDELTSRWVAPPLCSTEGGVEGWYHQPEQSSEPPTLLKAASCKNLEVECRYQDAEFEGWYNNVDGSLVSLGDCSEYHATSTSPPEGVSIVLNSHTGKSCAEICQESGKYCIGIGADDIASSGQYYYYANNTCLEAEDTSEQSCEKKMSTSGSAICRGHQVSWTNCRCSSEPPPPGPTLPAGEAVILNENSGYSCEQLCLSYKNGPCLSVGTDLGGTDGQYQSSWDMTCSTRRAAVGCQEVLSNSASRPCSGHYTDWTNCRCRLPTTPPASLAKELPDISIMATPETKEEGGQVYSLISFQLHGQRVAGLSKVYGFTQSADPRSLSSPITFNLNTAAYPRFVSDAYSASIDNTVDLYSSPDRSDSAYLASFRYSLFFTRPGDRGRQLYFPGRTSYFKFDYDGPAPNALIALSSPYHKVENPSPVFATYYFKYDYRVRGTFTNIVYSILPPINLSDSQATNIWCNPSYPTFPKKEVQNSLETYPVQGGNFYQVVEKEGVCNLIYRQANYPIIYGFFKISLSEM